MLLVAGITLTLLLAAAVAVFLVVPRLVLPRPRPLPAGETVDVIIVLGCRAREDGTPGTVLKSRLDHALELYRLGVAPRILMTGAAVYTKHIEAEVMARYAREQGVPDAAIVREPEATNTLENAIRAAGVMRANGWKRAVVVSTDCHVFRASQMFAGRGLEYFISGAPPIGASLKVRLGMILWERYLIWRVVKRRMEQRKGIHA
jgi:uncharacterized SAM-binding protein YcdF (DUF218 family)